jgi:hypothetical protein
MPTHESFDVRGPISTLEDGSDYSSTNVHSLLYDFGKREMVARYYRDGADALYVYPNFPAQVWNGLATASSKGRFINLNVRDYYPFSRKRISRLPERGRGIDDPVARRFVTRPLTTNEHAGHPHMEA